jgi:hypothetical protein
MTALAALWLCGLCALGLYSCLPETGVRQDIYYVTLGILSTCVMMVSATILVVILISPLGIHVGKWM